MRICAILGCSNGTYRLQKWKNTECIEHGCRHVQDGCSCTPPFTLYPFPTEKSNPEERQKWIKAVNRKNPKTGSNWLPSADDRVCSVHFVEGKPTTSYTYPTINLGYKAGCLKPKRPAPKTRETLPKEKKVKVEEQVRKPLENVNSVEINAVIVTHESQDENVPPVDRSSVLNQIKHDHCYTYLRGGQKCEGCDERKKIISHQQTKIEQLKSENSVLHRKLSKEEQPKIFNKFIETDKKVRTYTGLPNKKAFESLLKHVSPKAKRIRYWCGTKKVTSTKVPRKFKKSPKKSGPQRKLSVKEELTLVLLKLRLAITNAMLADLFSISLSTTSQIFNTWVKFLAKELKPLIFWPSKEDIQQHLPISLRGYPNLRCTIDCSEVFIGRPRDLEMQALTWSDYKKHNTVKFLVGIAPNGMISFLSKAWGGRASDQLITRGSGFLNLVDPNDLILADRGFLITEDIMLRRATLDIPPPSSGVEQMTKDNVKRTKKIANARIHVERAIGRMKWFTILQNTLPITLIPLIDDILTVCAALCNLLKPLVK